MTRKKKLSSRTPVSAILEDREKAAGRREESVGRRDALGDA